MQKTVASQLIKKLSPPLDTLKGSVIQAQQRGLPCEAAILKRDEAMKALSELQEMNGNDLSSIDPNVKKEVRV